MYVIHEKNNNASWSKEMSRTEAKPYGKPSFSTENQKIQKLVLWKINQVAKSLIRPIKEIREKPLKDRTTDPSDIRKIIINHLKLYDNEFDNLNEIIKFLKNAFYHQNRHT